MAQVVNKKNMTISIREYTNSQGQVKKVWKTIGEITTWDDGSQSFELWGPTGSTMGQVFEKQDQQNTMQQNPAPVSFGQPSNGFNQQAPVQQAQAMNPSQFQPGQI